MRYVKNAALMRLVKDVARGVDAPVVVGAAFVVLTKAGVLDGRIHVEFACIDPDVAPEVRAALRALSEADCCFPAQPDAISPPEAGGEYSPLSD